jgi:transposase
MRTAPDPIPAHPSDSVASPGLPAGEYAALIGLDWGDKQHAIALQPRDSSSVETCSLEHSAESLHAWLDELGRRFHQKPVAVALEASRGAVVAALLEHPFIVVYPVHPATSRSLSKAFTPSGAKDDGPDAVVLLEALLYHRSRLRALIAQDEDTRRLTLLSEARRKLVDRRTLLTNQLQSLLKNFYPQALELIGEAVCAPLSLDFLSRWPQWSALAGVRPQTLRRFYRLHGVRREEVIAKRLEAFSRARPLTQDAALCEVSVLQLRALVAEIRLLNEHVTKADEAIAAAFRAHADAHIFESFPGAGAAMAPRLCALFGTDRERWQSAQQMQKHFGVAPVIEKSGKKRWVHWRWNAPVFARQTLVEWAGQSVRACAWAKAYYLQQKSRGHGHSAILRSLAFKWLRVLWRCWRDRKPYDDALYLQKLRERKVAFLSFLPAA